MWNLINFYIVSQTICWWNWVYCSAVKTAVRDEDVIIFYQLHFKRWFLPFWSKIFLAANFWVFWKFCFTMSKVLLGDFSNSTFWTTHSFLICLKHDHDISIQSLLCIRPNSSILYPSKASWLFSDLVLKKNTQNITVRNDECSVCS